MTADSDRLGLLFLDIDNFKSDAHAGDCVIAEVARRLLDVMRNEDLCAAESAASSSSSSRAVIRGAGDGAEKILDAIRSRRLKLAATA